jgi:RNA polymerase sigma-70 factor (ECF subfamily)
MVFSGTIALAHRLFEKKGERTSEDEEAPSFDEVYEQHFAFAWRTMRGLGVQHGYLDDAVQDAFVIIHRRLGDFVPTASLRSWIFGIVRRVAKDYRRAEARRGPHVSVEERYLGADTNDPYIEATRNEALALVAAFSETLDEKRRAIFVLSELEQMSVPEISSTLGMNVNTVYSRLKVMKRNLTRFVAQRLGRGQGDFYE